MVSIIVNDYWVANSMVEYSAFNRLVPGSSPGQPTCENLLIVSLTVYQLYHLYICFIFCMLSISKALLTSRSISNCALVPFVTAGYPDLHSTVRILHLLDRRGADVIELGIPYSDALADGPVIQQASCIALQQKVYLEQVLQVIKQVSANLNAPIVVFTYYNIVLSHGISYFVEGLFLSGAKGLVIPDLPIEESGYLMELCNQCNIELIFFISPSSSKSRIASIVSKSPGCIYLVTSYGVTGVRDEIQDKLENTINYIKKYTNKSIMLGFGISSIQQISKIAQWNIDGIVIGSAFIQRISHGLLDKNYKELECFCSKVKYAIESN